MAGKQLVFDEEARSSLMRGVDELAKAVGLHWDPAAETYCSLVFGPFQLYVVTE